MAEIPIEVKKPTAVDKPAHDVWGSFRSEMDRLFDRFGGSFNMAPIRRMFDAAPAARYETAVDFTAPAVDVNEDTNAYKITAELPGMAEKDVEVRVSGDLLTIKGEKRHEKEEKDKNYHMSERSFGMFERSFAIPKGVDRDKIAANFAKGVLTLSLPKRPDAQPETKKIEVKGAD